MLPLSFCGFNHMFFSNYVKLCHSEDYMCADVIRDICHYPHSDSDLEHIVYAVSSAESVS